MKHLYIAWVPYQRRPDSMRPAVGYELQFIPPPFQSQWLKPLGYLWQTVTTCLLVLRIKPDVIWYQSPPTFLAHLMWLLRLISRGRLKVVADCHNAAFRAPWARFPFTTFFLNRLDLVLAHNEEVLRIARELGVATQKLIVLETRPAQVTAEVLPASRGTGDSGSVVFVPSSFSEDEPIDILLGAAILLPAVTFQLTGRLSKARSKGYVARAPVNVQFTDYIDIERFNELLWSSDLVIGLTTQESIQLSAANEAVGAGKPLVLSDTGILRELFGAAAIFASNEPEALAHAIEEALGQRAALAERTRALRLRREQRWQDQLGKALKAADILLPIQV